LAAFRSSSSARAAAVLVSAAAIASAAQLPAPKVADVLSRLDAYLERYEITVATIVAEERYSQALERTSAPAERQTRTLRSDYALARSPGGHAWSGFRDTYDVDGQPVRGREQRLLALLADGSAASSQQALRITRENARYNIGEDIVTRTINVPTVALDLIHRRHRARMSIEKRGEEAILGRQAWVIAFRERDRPTILRTPDGRDRRSLVAVRVDPATGEVLRTDLSWDGAPGGFIVVHYRRDDGIGALVPDMMLEEYRGMKGVVTGTATYTNYRRFQTTARLLPGAP
jgi:hypothetical protein